MGARRGSRTEREVPHTEFVPTWRFGLCRIAQTCLPAGIQLALSSLDGPKEPILRPLHRGA